MQQHSLLATKLYIPPIRPELVSRPRLIKRLNAGLPKRGAFPRALTLVSAPAGFGKTTLVSEWVHGLGWATPPVAVAWLSLDEDDRDPARFLAYLIAALRTHALSQAEENEQRPGDAAQQEPAGSRPAAVGLMGQGVLSALQSPQPPPTEAVLTSLINEIAAFPDSIILVFDDYHTVKASPVDDALAFLLERLPPQMHLVIATREDPHLPLARLRARGQLTEVRAADLRFTSAEAAEFLNQVMGLDLSAEDIAALDRRTEGWIAGLQLAALSVQGRGDAANLIQSFTGSHRYVLDFLVEEVLEQQSEEVQTFLLQTSILDRLTGSLCDAVRFGQARPPSTADGTAHTGGNDGRAILEMLERANLFIVPLDDERRWYRYHHLFAGLLRQRLHQDQPELDPTLHTRASKWYEQNGLVDEAVTHALRAREFERAAKLIESVADTAWARGEYVKLRRWLDRLPADVVLGRPQLGVYRAWELFTSGRVDAAERFLETAGLAHDPNTDCITEPESLLAEQSLVSGGLSMTEGAADIQAWMAAYRRHSISGLIQHLRQALDDAPDQDLDWRTAAATTLGDAHAFGGDLLAAHQARLEALRASEAAGNPYLFLYNSAKLALNLKAQGRLQEVQELCEQRVRSADESGMSQSTVVGWLLAIWGEALAERNELDGALDLAERSMERTERGGDVGILGWSCLSLTRVLFSKGEMASAEAVVQKLDRVARESIVPTWIVNLNAAWQSRIWLAQGKLGAASQWVKERVLEPDQAPTHLSGFEYLALARILIAQGRWDETTKLLERMLAAAEVGGDTTRTIEIRLLQALAFEAGGDRTLAMDALAHAFTLAESEGFVRIFVDEGLPMARLLYEALDRGIAPEYARRLLAAFPMPESQQGDPPDIQSPESGLIEPLSERELEVLKFMSEGLTNPEIASRLFLSLHTVKTHARNIYGKLGVHNRTEAVTRAMALGVLPSVQLPRDSR